MKPKRAMSEMDTTKSRSDHHVTRKNQSQWIIVLVTFLCHVVVGGTFYSFGLFYIEFVEHFQCSVSEAGWIGSTFIFCFHLSGLFFSVIVRRYGCRFVATSGALVAASGFIITSFVTSLPVLYLTYGVVTGIGCGMLWLPTLVIVQFYFTRGRSLAAGVSTSGFTVGTIAMTPLQRHLLDEYGWRGTVLIMAALLLQCAVFTMFYRPLAVKKSPDAPSPDPPISCQRHKPPDSSDQGSAKAEDRKMAALKRKLGTLEELFREFGEVSLMKNDIFVMFVSGTFLMDIGMIAFSQHNPNRAVHYGIPVHQASLLPLVNGVSDAVSRVTSGLLGNQRHVDRALQYGVLVLLGGVLATIFVFAKRFEVFVLYTVLFGIFTGGFCGIQQTVQVDLFGVERLARSQALLSGFVAIACLITTPLAGYLYDVTGDYDVPFYVTGSMQIVGGVILCIAAILYTTRTKSTQTSRRTQELSSVDVTT